MEIYSELHIEKKMNSLRHYTKLFLVLLFLSTMSSWGQNYPNRHYTSSEFLSNHKVTSLLSSKNGDLWVGTEFGLMRKRNDVFQTYLELENFDGVNINELIEDSKGRIWIGSNVEGLRYFEKGKFYKIPQNDLLSGINVTGFFINENRLYVGSSEGVVVIDLDSLELIYRTESYYGRVINFFEYNNEIYAVTYGHGTFKLASNKTNLDLILVNEETPIYSIFLDGNSLYRANKGSVSMLPVEDFVQGKSNAQKEDRHGPIIFDFQKIGKNEIYVAGWGIYNDQGGLFRLKSDMTLEDLSHKFGIYDHDVVSLAYNEEFKHFYSGSLTGGLSETDLNGMVEIFSTYGVNIQDFARSETSNAVLYSSGIQFQSPKDTVYISKGNLKEIQEAYVQDNPSVLNRPYLNYYEIDFEVNQERIRLYRIQEFQGHYVANTSIGIYVFSSMGSLERYIPIHSEHVTFGPDGELIEFNPFSGSRVYKSLFSEEFTYFESSLDNVPSSVVGTLRLKDQTYITSIFDGLFKFKNGTFHKVNTEDFPQLQNLKNIAAYKDKYLAVSNLKGEVFIVYDGTEFEEVIKIERSVIEGKNIKFLTYLNENLIIGTDRGITVFDGKKYLLIDHEQGVSPPLYGAVKEGKLLYVGGMFCYYTIDLTKVLNTEFDTPDIKLDFYEVLGEQVFNPEGETVIQVPSGLSNLEMTYEIGPHPYPKKIRYQFSLNNMDSWSAKSSKPQISIPFIPMGETSVYVKISDLSSGLFHVQKLTTVSALPPVYFRWWFLTSVLFVIILSVYLWWRYSQKKIENQAKLEKRVEQVKLEALLAQMNPHFIYNAMNSIQAYILDNDVNKASQFLGDFSNLIRKNLEYSKKQKVLVYELVDYVNQYIRIENVRFDHRVTVHFDVDPRINIYIEEVPGMILQPFIENVFVHAFSDEIQDPCLEIYILKTETGLRVTIKDNGIGIKSFSKHKVHNSRGTLIVKERLELMGYNLEKSLKEEYTEDGTSITLCI